MRVDFQNLSAGSRIWIYTSPCDFSSQQQQHIATETNKFLGGWQRHGTDLSGGYAIFYERFLVLSADEKMPVSGCSIDASVHFIQKLSGELGIDLLEKRRVDYLLQKQVMSCTIPQFKEHIKAGRISEETLVFNHLIQTKADLEKKWLIPAKNSWHKRFF